MSIELKIYEELLIGYYSPIDLTELDLESLDISNIYEKHFVNKDLNEVMVLFEGFPKDQLNLLDIESTFRIDLKEQVFYTIKNLENGNYLAINVVGEVFGLFYDPFLIEKIYSKLNGFIADLNSGKFSVDEFMRAK